MSEDFYGVSGEYFNAAKVHRLKGNNLIPYDTADTISGTIFGFKTDVGNLPSTVFPSAFSNCVKTGSGTSIDPTNYTTVSYDLFSCQYTKNNLGYYRQSPSVDFINHPSLATTNDYNDEEWASPCRYIIESQDSGLKLHRPDWLYTSDPFTFYMYPRIQSIGGIISDFFPDINVPAWHNQVDFHIPINVNQQVQDDPKWHGWGNTYEHAGVPSDPFQGNGDIKYSSGSGMFFPTNGPSSTPIVFKLSDFASKEYELPSSAQQEFINPANSNKTDPPNIVPLEETYSGTDDILTGVHSFPGATWTRINNTETFVADFFDWTAEFRYWDEESTGLIALRDAWNSNIDITDPTYGGKTWDQIVSGKLPTDTITLYAIAWKYTMEMKYDIPYINPNQHDVYGDSNYYTEGYYYSVERPSDPYRYYDETGDLCFISGRQSLWDNFFRVIAPPTPFRNQKRKRHEFTLS